MRRALVGGVVVALAAAACHRQPKTVLEYGETVTYTSTANDPAPQPAATATPDTTAASSAMSPADAASAGTADQAPEPSGATYDGTWTTSVQTESPPSRPAAPSESSAPAPPRQWYKAKPW